MLSQFCICIIYFVALSISVFTILSF